MGDLPQNIGKYNITGIAGKGAMGIVYIGHDPFVDRVVAIKVSKQEVDEDGMSAHQRKMFFNEAKAAGALDHPNILRVYDAGEADNQPYIVMEFVDNAKTLRDFVQPENLLPVKTVLEYAVQAALALDYAHQRGITHRDIKPANLMLTTDGLVKICDFGIAQRAKADQTQLIGWFGSPLYMSPEQAADSTITSQSDLFSLGVVMYELLTAKTPFAAKGISTLINNVLHKEPESVLDVRPDLPPKIWAVIKKCLEKPIAKRYRTGAELAADINAVINDLENPYSLLTDEQKLGLLKGLALFKEFSDPELKDLVRAGRWESLRAGVTVIEEGTQSSSLYLIISGDVVVKRAGKEVATLTQGECFGEMGYLGDGKRSASVVASGTVAVMRIDAPMKEWASLPVQLKLTRVFQRVLIERLATTTRNLAKYL